MNKLSCTLSKCIIFVKKLLIFFRYTQPSFYINETFIVDCFNIFYLGFGAGAFYRHGYYHLDNIKDNISLKIGLSFSFK